MKTHDKWEDAIRSKLKDFEVATDPTDWEAIESRLRPKGAVVPIGWWRYVAAVVMIGLLCGGFYLFQNSTKPLIADQVLIDSNKGNSTTAAHEGTGNKQVGGIDESVPEQPLSGSAFYSTDTLKSILYNSQTVSIEEPLVFETLYSNLTGLHVGELSLGCMDAENVELIRTLDEQFQRNEESDIPLLANTQSESDFLNTKPVRRWRFGFGGGSYSVNNHGVGGDFFSKPSGGSHDYSLNSIIYNYPSIGLHSQEKALKKIDVKHKRPLSFGVGVGYALNDRWTLQSGLVYSILNSEWKTDLYYPNHSKQRLHFVGIPLGLNYGIADWKKFHWYASAGCMTEYNVSGQIKSSFSQHKDLKESSSNQFLRMKEWQWSVNARTGISYPLFRFLQAYVEGGANYYFDNGSSIETIRSDKPFHVSLQAGIRLGL